MAAGQVLPQLPQLLKSCAVLRHELLQQVRLPVQAAPPPHWQTPLTQVEPAEQAAPQAPQLAVLESVATHVPPQQVSPAAQRALLPHMHWPPAQLSARLPQSLPQLPQFARSLLKSLQAPLQHCLPPVQADTLPHRHSDSPQWSAVAASQLQSHAPQRSKLEVTSTHVSSQQYWPDAHGWPPPHMQTPSTHWFEVRMHRWPQAPQSSCA